MKRRTFLQATLAATPLAATPGSILTRPDRNSKGFVVKAGEGRLHGHMQLQGANPVTMDLKVSGKDTNGELVIFEQTSSAPRLGPPLHVHYKQEEIFYVLEGRYLFQLGEEKFELGAGETIFLPRNIPHAFVMLSDRGKMLVMLQPAGTMEEFFLYVASPGYKNFTAQERARDAQKHGFTDTKYVGPPIKPD
jgi:quercetin dioxygenase-like cupin family protein